MKSKFKHYNLNKALGSFARHFGFEVLHDCQKKRIDLAGQAGHGRLFAYDFEDGVQAFLFDGTLSEEWQIETQSNSESPFMLYICIRGDVAFSYNGLEDAKPIEPMKVLMTTHPALQRQSVILRQGAKTTFIWLSLERQLYVNHISCLPEAVQAQVREIFNGKTVIREFQGGEYSLKGAALVQQILDDSKQGLIHATFVESKVMELFSMQLRRWEEEMGNAAPIRKGQLRPNDFEKIVMARNLLVADLRNAPTIEALSKKSGVNRQKLKQGFKQMFGLTINDYLRNERLRVARRLLLGIHTVREVASSIGYENPSYFARRFREKYGVYPHEFMGVAPAASEEE